MKSFKTILMNGKLFITDEQEHSHVAVQQDRVISERDYGYFINASLHSDESTFAPQQRFVFELTDPEGESIHDGGSIEFLYDAVKFYFDTEFAGRPYTISVPETSFVYEEPLFDDTESE